MNRFFAGNTILTLAFITAATFGSDNARLEREIDSAMAADYTAEPLASEQAADEAHGKRVVVIKENKDTVFILNTTSHSKCVRDVKASLDTIRRKGYGFGGGPLIGVNAINIEPLIDLVDRVQPLAGREFSFNQYGAEPFLLKGGMGYAGVGNGLRLGGGGMHGSRRFVSAKRAGDTSFVVMDVDVGYGGFMIEKAFVRDRFTMIAGGMIGGGDFEVKAQLVDTSDYSIFSHDELDVDEDEITAGFFNLEVHGAMTYTVCPIFHLGLDVSIPVFVSTNGFEPYTADFATVNPGVRVRFIFGNLG
jgi:hypothetical protein